MLMKEDGTNGMSNSRMLRYERERERGLDAGVFLTKSRNADMTLRDGKIDFAHMGCACES